ncbi:MAG: PHP domain-containing protein [Bacteroidetes bacterium]|nr:PHP domain-containing protein [Bacteroidota bacterium]
MRIGHVLALVSLLALPTQAQDMDHPHAHGRAITFPDVEGYLTLKVDLHMHTVFSDGKVWPNIRVEEALKDGLDAIAITEHLEYQPHRADIPHPDRNRAFDIAQEAAGDRGLLVIRGSEITRSMAPGHANAIFLDDANPLLKDDAEEAYTAARQQGAFIFWNHPAWLAQAPDGVPPLSPLHRNLIETDRLHGIEVVNMFDYSAEALQIALDHNLTILGTSDIHGLIDWEFDIPGGGHRPITMVFAEERTEASLKEALFEGRTAVWFNDMLIGREQYLVPLLEATLEVTQFEYVGREKVARVTIANHSDAELIVRNQSPYSLHRHGDIILLAPHTHTEIQVMTLDVLDGFALPLEVLSATIAPNTHPTITLRVE